MALELADAEYLRPERHQLLAGSRAQPAMRHPVQVVVFEFILEVTATEHRVHTHSLHNRLSDTLQYRREGRVIKALMVLPFLVENRF